MAKIQENGTVRNMTAEEVSTLEADKAINAVPRQAEADALTAKRAVKASAKEKLVALGLTSDEIDQIKFISNAVDL